MLGRFDGEPARVSPAREPRGHTPQTARGRLVANQDSVGAGRGPPGIVAIRDPGEKRGGGLAHPHATVVEGSFEKLFVTGG